MKDNGYRYLMDVHNRIEEENVIGILECEGIKAKAAYPKVKLPGRQAVEGEAYAHIYVPDSLYNEAAEAIEAEMVRGDF